MSGIAVVSLDRAEGIQLGNSGSPWTVDGQSIVLVGDAVQSHPPCPVVPIHCAPTMAQGSSWFTLDGIPVCAAGDLATCGHPSTGRAWFDIDE